MAFRTLYPIFSLLIVSVSNVLSDDNVPQWKVNLKIHVYNDLVGKLIFQHHEKVADKLREIVAELITDANVYFNGNFQKFNKHITFVHNRQNIFIRQLFYDSNQQILPYLEYYCEWAQTRKEVLNLDDGMLYVLLTATDLHDHVNGNVTETKGDTYTGKMCDVEFGCAVMKYNTKRTVAENAYVLARLVARSMDAHYDGQNNDCDPKTNFMSPQFDYIHRTLDWSSCSTKGINNFMASKSSACVENVNEPLPSIKDQFA